MKTRAPKLTRQLRKTLTTAEKTLITLGGKFAGLGFGSDNNMAKAWKLGDGLVITTQNEMFQFPRIN